MRYVVIDNRGRHKGTQTLTDAMAGRLEARGYHLLPAGQPVITWTPGGRR